MKQLRDYIAENSVIRKTEELLKKMGGTSVVVQRGYFQALFPSREKALEVKQKLEADGLSGFEMVDDPGDQGVFLKWQQ